MDRDVNTSGMERRQWRSRAVERKRALAGVMDAALGSRTSAFRKTLAICAVAAIAVSAMVTAGLMIGDNGVTAPERNVVVVPAGEDVEAEAASSAQPNEGETEQLLANFGLAALDGRDEEPRLVVRVEPNRADCASILGTPYESETERLWFLSNCVDGEQPTEPATVYYAPAPSAPAVAGGQPEVASAPVPEQDGISQGEAIATTVDWIVSQPNNLYDVPAGACSATGAGPYWLVSCETSLQECAPGECITEVSVCVTDVDGTVRASATC